MYSIACNVLIDLIVIMWLKNLNALNKITLKLAKEINRTISKDRLESLAESDDMIKYDDDDESQDPMYVEIPKSAKLFRVLLERKLGIDWEHDNLGSEESSLQTNWNH